jgi:hypothetical protein
MTSFKIWLTLLFVVFVVFGLINTIRINRITWKYRASGLYVVWSEVTDAEKRKIKKYKRQNVISILVYLVATIATFLLWLMENR